MLQILKRWRKNYPGSLAPTPHTYIIWSLMAVLTAATMLGLKMSGMFLAQNCLFSVVLQVAGLSALAFIYTYFRPDARIAAMTHILAVYITIGTITIIFSYLTTALGRPLVDNYLVATDRALGLNWLAIFKWVNHHNAIHQTLLVAYRSIGPQALVMILVLNFLGLIARCWEMMWLFTIACLTTLFFSAIWPAAGAFGYFHIHAPYVDTFMALHNGTMKGIGDKDAVEGIIQFPSFHIELAIIIVYAARGIRILFPLALAVNILLLISTLPIGGHHFADVLGGAIISLAMILSVRKTFKPAYVQP